MVIPTALEITPRMIWNASASAPLGLYLVGGKSELRRGDLVLADLPKAIRPLADERGYLPRNVPLVKRIAAVAGDDICTIGRAILINGKLAARRHKRDSEGRVMPAWRGCRLLTEGEVFLLMEDVPNSFDGRYFGPSKVQEIIGRLRPLWTWVDAEGADAKGARSDEGSQGRK